MKQMTEKEIREWVDNDDGTWEEMCVKFARHVGALKEPVVKYQWAWKSRVSIRFEGITIPMTYEEAEKRKEESIGCIYVRLDFTRTEE